MAASSGRPVTLAELLKRAGESEFLRERVALVTAEDARKKLSYGDVSAVCKDFGRRLCQEWGLVKGDVVAIVLPRRVSLAQVIGTLGCMGAGLCAAPLNPTYKTEELEFFIGDAQAKVVVVEAANESGRSAWIAATTLGLPTCGMTLEWPTGATGPRLTLSAAKTGGVSAKTSDGGEWSFGASPEDLALVLHTSGTTSRPKLVPLTHANMVASVDAVVRHYGISSTDNTLIVQPLFHIGGLVTPLLSTLSVGGSVAIAQMFDDGRHWQFVDEHAATWFTAVPTIHKVLLANAQRDYGDGALSWRAGRPPLLRFIRSGSAALPPEFLAKIEAAFHAPLIESYGMTEAAQLICANPLPPGPRYAGSVGICAGPRGRVFDAETGKPAVSENPEDDIVGEMCIAGPSVMTGYARNPSANEGSFLVDAAEPETRWFRTGDLVSRTPAGYYSIVGRIKEIINRAGEKIAPAKLDKVLAYKGRKDSVVAFGVPDPDFGQAVAAVLVFDPDTYPDDVGFGLAEAKVRAEALLKTALDKLAPHELPTRLYFMHKENVLKTATGKTRRIKTGELCLNDYVPLLDKGVWRVDEETTTNGETKHPTADAPEKATDTAAISQTAPAATSRAELLSEAKARAKKAIAEALVTVGVPLAVADDAPLMQSGLTSMMVFGFVKAVAASLELDHQLPHMLVFDAPTPDALGADLAERLVTTQIGTAAIEKNPLLLSSRPDLDAVDVVVKGASWRLPGAESAEHAPDPRAVRSMLDSLGNASTPVPASRWGPDAIEMALGGPQAPNFEALRQRCSVGGFVQGIGALDHAYFGMSKNEAALCDPQQRMLLEHVSSALHAADPTTKPPADGGVFVGISFNDWANLTMWNAQTPNMRKSVFASSGSFTSYASGRLSFALGMRGPCVSVNTACSSGLVALHGARAAIRAGDASTCVAACTNAILEPTISINFAVKGITSPRGRCHTFDASADGYMRSEACVAVALTSASAAGSSASTAASDFGAVSVDDVVVRHDGKSASLTAPNGAAQVAMLSASFAARDFYEAHGTATPLGDPIEVGGLARYLAKAHPTADDPDTAVPLSGAKSAYGHGEAVAGMIGLLAGLLALGRGEAAPNGALRRINPAVKADRGAILSLAPTDALPIASETARRACGVSSLGASGTIAHAVVSAETPDRADGLLNASWLVFPNRVELPWAPWTPPEAALVAAPASDDAAASASSPSDVLAAVRAAIEPLVDGDLDDAIPLLDQGVDSLVAIELVAELQAKFSAADLPQTLLVDYPSVEAIAALVASVVDDDKTAATSTGTSVPLSGQQFPNTEGEDGPTVVVKKASGSRPEAPLAEGEQIFFVHGVDGDPLAMLFHQVAGELRFPSSTVRCIEKPKSECFCIEDLAAYYVARIKERQPSGRYRLFGHSFGALIAHQIAVQLERAGDEVAALILGDFEVTYPPSRSQKSGLSDKGDVGRFGLEEWEGGEIEGIKLACRRFGSQAAGGAGFDPDAFRAKVLTNASTKSERRMRAMFHYMPSYMQRREWERLLDLWERNMEFLYTVTVPKFGPKRRDFWQPDAIVKGPVLHLRAAQSHEFAAAEHLNAKYCADYAVETLDGLHYTFLQKPHADGVAKAIDAFVTARGSFETTNGPSSRSAATSAPASEAAAVPTSPKAAVAAVPRSLKAVVEGDGSTLAGLVAARAARTPDKAFVVAWERKEGVVETVSFGAFAARCAATARRLAEYDPSSTSAAILSHATVPAHVAVIALSALGRAAVVLNPRLRPELLASLVDQVQGCGCLIAGLSLRALAARVAPAAAGLAKAKTLLLVGSQTRDQQALSAGVDPDHERLLSTAAAAAPTDRWWAASNPDAPAIVMFTSGTTAAPKAVARSARRLLQSAARMRAYEERVGVAGDEGTLSFLPLYHMMGLAHNLCLNLLVGGRLLVHAAAPSMPLTLGLLLEAAPALRPSQLEVVAVTAEQLGEMLAVGGELARDIQSRLASVACLKVGGSELARRVVATVAGADLAVLEHYGQTELCGYVLAKLSKPGVAPLPRPRLNSRRASSEPPGTHNPDRSLSDPGLEPGALDTYEPVDLEPVDPSLRVWLRTGTPDPADDGGPDAGSPDAAQQKSELSLPGELLLAGLDPRTPDAVHATGDIFLETAPGKYTFRSRVDGMLVLGSGEMVDPAAVEAVVLRDLAYHVQRCCLVGNRLSRPALLVQLRDGAPEDSVLDAVARAVDALNQTHLDAATALLHTHVLLIDDVEIPTTLKGAVDRSAAHAMFNDDVAAADAGCLVHSSLQAYKLGYGPKE